ncbi:hypothetical protein PRIPAC_86807 [Pristionchus pacificus]|uniref:Uncharacterized protein n=1 Tax=Pristionchus pacificus TaxID=54126 RepID=A0A2A6CEU5_PRIPA|nr:hypothetical protein PRIPAC_86807 [Pristionchus pacificus]|eukprot:PDM76608.1 hypothetical protein PRIPAC_42974 [Pristionchus pacificus]
MGKFRNKKNFKNRSKSNGQWTQDRVVGFTKTNDKLFDFYKKQGLIPAGEWDQFVETLKNDLPVSFRIQGCHKYDGAYQTPMSRSEVRSHPTHAALHNFLVTEAELGSVTRQEAVSMIPPLLLKPEAHHHVLDVCAAPGSKTMQLIEMQHETDPNPSGFIIANDVDKKRSYLLCHQVLKRMKSANCVVICEDGALMPNLKAADDSVLKFDRVLCEVICSGDGTLRKNPDIWPKWTPQEGLGLHKLQLSIARRSVQQLKVGGLLVYSTCSVNPMEDEAVVAQLLREAKGALRLVDAHPRLPGLKASRGVSQWKVFDRDMNEYATTADIPTEGPLTRALTASMWPPSEEEAKEMNLHHVMRLPPHQQDTGGFFVALIERVAEDAEDEERRVGARYGGGYLFVEIRKKYSARKAWAKKSKKCRSEMRVGCAVWGGDRARLVFDSATVGSEKSYFAPHDSGFMVQNVLMKFENFKLVVTEGNLKVVASVLCWCGRFPGFVSFEQVEMFSSVFGASSDEEEEEEDEVQEGILAFPNEVIARIFSHLCIADRLNAAAMNRRLNDIEKRGKYHTKKLHIEMEVRFNWKTFRDRALYPEDGNEYKYHLLNEFEDLACLERVFKNTTFDAIHVHFHLDRPIYRRLMEMIRDCDATDLSMEIEDRNESLGDSTHYDIVLLDLVMTRKVVVFKSHCRAKLLERGFMRVYSAIMTRSIPPLESLEIHGYACRFVLDSIGFRIGSVGSPESLWAHDTTQYLVFVSDDTALFIFNKHVLIRVPSGYDPNPSSLLFTIYDEEKVKKEIAEIGSRDDFVQRWVHQL